MKPSLFIVIEECIVLIELNEILCCAPGDPDTGYRLPSKHPITLANNPHQVAVLRNDQSIDRIGDINICSGSLITPKWILTAAQCVSTREVRVILGVTNLQDRSRGMEFTVTSKDMIPHPQYKESSLSNDIALIRLPRSVAPNRNIEPAHMAGRSNESYINTMTVLPGWGRSTLFADRLKQTVLEVISNEKCQEAHREPFFYVQCTNLCTASTLSDVCAIDIGAPLIYMTPGKERILIGLVSKPPSACKSAYPTIYTRVSLYRFWVLRVINSELPDAERASAPAKKAVTPKKTRNENANATLTTSQDFVMPEFDEEEDED